MRHKLLMSILIGLCIFTSAYILFTAESLYYKQIHIVSNMWSESEISTKIAYVKQSSASSFNSLIDSVQCNKNTVDNKTEREIAEFLSEDMIIERTESCANYFQSISSVFTYDPSKSSCKVNGENFPLAFSISTHQQIGILEVFLALFFRPCDSYCVHLDSKADPRVVNALKSLVKCYRMAGGSIFLHPKPIPVVWGSYSVLETDLLCMQEFIKRVSTTNISNSFYLFLFLLRILPLKCWSSQQDHHYLLFQSRNTEKSLKQPTEA